jgi:hypothetical protein
LEEITNSHRAKPLCGYPEKLQQAQLEKMRKAQPEESQRAVGNDKCIMHMAEFWSSYKCMDFEYNQ